MDEKPDQIMNHIEEQRKQLGRNLNELETRVRENADWRTWFDRNPMMMMGAALGGGLLLGTAIGGPGRTTFRRRRAETHRLYGDIGGRSRTHDAAEHNPAEMGAASAGVGTAGASSSTSGAGVGQQTPSPRRERMKSAVSTVKQSQSWHDISEMLDDVRAALIAFGIVKAKEFLTHSIPGFQQHLEEAQAKREGRRQTGSPAGQKNPEHEGATHDEQSHARQKSHHLYTPSGEQLVRSGSWSSDPVGTYTP